MKRYLLLLIPATLIFSMNSCKLFKSSAKKETADTVTTASGLKYIITQKGNGAKADSGDIVTVNYVGKLTNDTIFDSTDKHGGKPFTFPLGKGRVIKGWDEGVARMHVGDKATLIIPPDLGYGGRKMGTIPPNSTLIFNVQLLKVQGPPKPYDVTGKDTVTTADGLKYIVVKDNPSGVKPQPGDKVTVNYTGYYTNGKIFDSSVQRDKPFSFPLGKHRVIKGWDEGVALMHEGEKARFIVPYQLAYGKRGYGPIPPEATLIFDVQLLKVTPKVTPKPYDIAGKQVHTTASGLKYIIVKQGNGAKADSGKTVTVNYTGYLADGKIFDSSVENGSPISFPLGRGMVIPGWEEGVKLMHVGDKFHFIIPAKLAYGAHGRPPVIPANATLTFDVELLKVE